VGGPHPEVGEDLSNDFGLFNEGDDPHWSRASGAQERIHLVHLLDEPCPRALRGRDGDLGEFLDGRWLFSLGLPALASTDITVPPVVSHQMLPRIGDVSGQGRQPVGGGE